MNHNTRSRVEGARLAHFDAITFETVSDNAPVKFYDDFVGAGSIVIPAAASAESGVAWCKKVVTSGGTATVAGVANGANGLVACALDSYSENQDALLYMNDVLNFDVTKGLVFEARVALTVLPSGTAARFTLGLQSAWNTAPDSVSYYLGFGATANGAINVRNQDGATQASASSGVTVLASAFHIYRIDCTDVTAIRFYIDGVDVTPAVAVPFVATGSSALLQPAVQVYKASGTTVATAQVDYVKVWTNRV